MKLKLLASLCFIATTMLLTGCSSDKGDGFPGDYDSFDASKIPDAVPKVEPRARYGNHSPYTVLGKRYTILQNPGCYHEKGIASWYGTKFHERRTSSGEPYDMYKMTAANKILPLPTYVRVHNLKNGRTAIVKVNDRGPFHENRIIDLSFAAAKKIGMTGQGTALVEISVIDPRHPNNTCGVSSSTSTAVTGTPRIYIQLGAFGNRANADALAQRVKQHTHSSVAVVTQHKGSRTWYKVQVGPVPDVDSADALTRKLESAGFGEAYAVVQ